MVLDWRDAWQEALYGADGFYRARRGPGRPLHHRHPRSPRWRPRPALGALADRRA